jgi:hypothetical protein
MAVTLAGGFVVGFVALQGGHQSQGGKDGDQEAAAFVAGLGQGVDG